MQPAPKAKQRPSDARLLVVDADGRLHHTVREHLVSQLQPGDVLIANDAATIPASLHGIHERTGEAIEIRLAGRQTLVLDDVHEFTAIAFGAGDYRTLTEARKPPPLLRVGDGLALGPLRATVERLVGHARLIVLHFDAEPDVIWDGIARHGSPIQYAHVDEPLELWDVWTRVAAAPVAFESPSASYVVDWQLLADLKARDIEFATITLAAGLSSTGDAALDTRFPLDEPYDLPERTVRAIARTWARSGRVVALGTSVTRALEHAASLDRSIRSGTGVATQRINENSQLRVVEAIITGVHEPGTSHFELLRAFAPLATLRNLSAELERCRYRSHEFGDSVLLEKQRVSCRLARQSLAEDGTNRRPSHQPP